MNITTVGVMPWSTFKPAPELGCTAMHPVRVCSNGGPCRPLPVEFANGLRVQPESARSRGDEQQRLAGWKDDLTRLIQMAEHFREEYRDYLDKEDDNALVELIAEAGKIPRKRWSG